jgi:hypothetical protein
MDPFTFIAMTVVSAAVSYGISYLFPAQGPRLKDLTVSASTYGAAIPQIFGTARSAGNLIWADKIKEHKKKKHAGKGGGSYIDYSYTCTFAFGFCKGPVTSVTKLWADGKVLRDLSGGSSTVTSSRVNMRVYLGDESQLPDADIETIDGVGNVPAYRGLCYIVFKDFQLRDYANRIPQMAAQVSVTATPTAIAVPPTPIDLPEEDPLAVAHLEFVPSHLLPTPLPFWGNNAIVTGPLYPGPLTWPQIDLVRGYWYTMANRADMPESATDEGVELEINQLNTVYGGITRIDLATMAQDKNIYNWYVESLFHFMEINDYGWDHTHNTFPVPEESIFRVYDNFISQICGVCPNDGSLIVESFTPGLFRPDFASKWTCSIVRLDPITYKAKTSLGEYHARVVAEPDGQFTFWPQVDEMIFSSSGLYLLRMNPTTTTDYIYVGHELEDYAGGQISIIEPNLMEFRKHFPLRRSPPGLITRGVCPLNDDDFCVAYNDDTTYNDQADVPADFNASRIEFYSSANLTPIPFFIDDGVAENTRHLNWVVWDSGSPGLIYCYTDMSSLTTPIYWLAKYSTVTESVVWRTRLPSMIFLSGNSNISGGHINMAMVDTLYSIDTTTGRYNSPYHNADGELYTSLGNFTAIDRDLSAELDNTYYVTYDNEPIGWPVTGATGGISIYQLFDGQRETVFHFQIEPGGFDSPAQMAERAANKDYMGRIVVSGVGNTTLGHIVENLLRQGGLTNRDFEVSDLKAVPVYGYGFANNSDIKGILAELRQVYQFDLFESDFILKGRMRGDSTTVEANIDQRALASSGEGLRDDWKQTRLQDADLPYEITLGYMDVDRDFQAGTVQHSRPMSPIPTMFSHQQASISANLVMTSTTAANLVRSMLTTQWTERTKHDTRLPWTYAYLDPSDLISINTLDSRSYFERIESMELGADLSLGTETFSQDSAVYLANSRIVGPGVSLIPGAIQAISPSIPFIINTPLLRDSDDTGGTSSRYYAGVGNYGGTTSAPFSGATLMISYDDESYDEVFSIGQDVEWGRVTEAVPAPAWGCGPVDWQTQITIVAAVGNFELTSITDSELWSGANPILIGSEVIQFRDALDNGDGSWTISYLLRGRRGTEWASTLHTDAEDVITLEGATIVSLSETLSSAGKSRWFKAISSTLSVNSQLGTEIVYTLRDLMPYSPADIRRVLAADIDIIWSRRTRFGGNMVDGTGEVPLHETSEAYELYILAAPYAGDASTGAAPASYVRKLDLTAPSFTYTAAMQATDSFVSATDTLHLAVFQVSAEAGRGFPGVRSIAPDQPF